MKMFKTALIAAAALASLSASAATIDLGPYTVDYDDSTIFGGVAFTFSSGSTVGFGFDIPSSVQAVSVGGGAVSAAFDLPSFTLTVNPGWTLSGPVTSFVGNLVFNEVGGGTTSASTSGDVTVNGIGPFGLGAPLVKTTTASAPGFASGYYSQTLTAPFGNITSLSYANGVLSFDVSGGAFASIIAQPQNVLEFSLNAVPVPEPETYALMLAGLGTVLMLARRRRAN